MTAHELLIYSVECVVDAEKILLGSHLRKENSLQQQVAELARKLSLIACVDRVHDLVGLFKEIGLDGLEGLLAVPWAAAGSPETGHEVHQQLKFFARAG